MSPNSIILDGDILLFLYTFDSVKYSMEMSINGQSPTMSSMSSLCCSDKMRQPYMQAYQNFMDVISKHISEWSRVYHSFYFGDNC